MSNNSKPGSGAGHPTATHHPKVRRSSASIRLPPEVGVEQADSLCKDLMKRVADVKAVTLDASEIQRIHTAALQLFCMFCRDRRAAGREVHWHKPSKVLRSAAALLGATTLLSLGMEQE